jgi:hypothetical protein
MKSLSFLLLGIFLLSSGTVFGQNTPEPKAPLLSKEGISTFISDIFRKKTPEEKAIRETDRNERRAARRARAKKRRQLKCSIAKNIRPECWQERDEAVINVALVYYGDDSMKVSDLDRIEPILKERFLKATDHALRINVVAKKILPFKQQMPKGFTYNNITDKKRLQRIWYYENIGAKVITEVYEEYIASEDIDTVHKLDSVLTITSAQFNALGFATGRMSVTEYPSEVAFGAKGGGRVDYPSDFTLVDELIHELGHNMFLGHTSTPCLVQKVQERMGITTITTELLQEVSRCCADSPSGNDVMSYCRKRADVSEDFMHGFESCNLDMIKNKIIPNMLSGGTWLTKDRSRCI